MIQQIKNFFKGKAAAKPREYSGLSDFLLHAPLEEQKRVITEAAHKANEDQMKVFKAAQIKTKVN
jgi:hypothetical protein